MHVTNPRSPRHAANVRDVWKFDERQRNVLPLDAARNEGRFWGKLLKSPQPLSVSQRLGAFIFSIPLLLLGILGISFVLSQPREMLPFSDPLHPAATMLLNVFAATVILVVLAASLLAGLRLLVNSLPGFRGRAGRPGPRR